MAKKTYTTTTLAITGLGFLFVSYFAGRNYMRSACARGLVTRNALPPARRRYR